MSVDVLMIGLRNVVGVQGGVESHVRNLALQLDRLGLKVGVCVRTPYAPRGQSLPGTQVRIVRIWSPKMVAAEALLHTLLCIVYAAFIRPRLVHIHAVGPSIMLPVARLFGLRAISTHHGEDYQREKWGPVARLLLRTGERFQALFAHRRICVSRSLAARLSKQYDKPFTYIPNGVEKPQALAPVAVLGELGLEPRNYSLTVSRLVPEKRHLDLIAAFATLPRDGAKLVIVGIADRKSAAYGARVEDAARQTPGVVMAGFRSGAELQALYENAALFALPSSHEGMPIALLEAIAHGCKVVVSDLPAHRDLDLPESAYHAIGDTSDLAARMARQIAEDRWAEADRDALLDRFRWSTIAAQTLSAYRDANADLALTVRSASANLPARSA